MNPQSQENLLTYLNDHWAGSMGAVALIDDLIAQNALPEFSHSLQQLRSEIEGDQFVLKQIIQRLGEETDGMKCVTAWFAEKLVRIKLQLKHAQQGALGAFEALELLALGVEGKRLLWAALDEYDLEDCLSPGTDLSTLILSAQDQGLRVQQWRLVVGRNAFCQK